MPVGGAKRTWPKESNGAGVEPEGRGSRTVEYGGGGGMGCGWWEGRRGFDLRDSEGHKCMFNGPASEEPNRSELPQKVKLQNFEDWQSTPDKMEKHPRIAEEDHRGRASKRTECGGGNNKEMGFGQPVGG